MYYQSNTTVPLSPGGEKRARARAQAYTYYALEQCSRLLPIMLNLCCSITTMVLHKFDFSFFLTYTLYEHY